MQAYQLPQTLGHSSPVYIYIRVNPARQTGREVVRVEGSGIYKRQRCHRWVCGAWPAVKNVLAQFRNQSFQGVVEYCNSCEAYVTKGSWKIYLVAKAPPQPRERGPSRVDTRQRQSPDCLDIRYMSLICDKTEHLGHTDGFLLEIYGRQRWQVREKLIGLQSIHSRSVMLSSGRWWSAPQSLYLRHMRCDR